MGRIILHDGPARRTIPAQTLQGVIEIDLSDDPVVTVPEDVEVVETSERRESPPMD